MMSIVLYGTQASCKDCKDRKLNCHDTCERYQKFKKACDEERKARHMASMKDDYGRPLGKKR